jgi:anti-repressor protein
VNTEIQPFTFPTTGQPVRTVSIDGEPWFVAADVTEILGYANGRDAIIRLVDDEDRRDYRRSEAVGIPYPFGDLRIQSVNLVNESGLYSLIMRSSISGAREFKRWVTAEVLPSIRRAGSYSVQQLSPRELAQLVIVEADRADRAEAKAAALEPAANAWNILATAAQDYDVAEAAQVLSRDPAIQTGRTRLFTILANSGWIYRGGNPPHWKPYQHQVELGRLMVMPKSHYHPRTGELVLDPPQVRITVKGIEALHKRLGGQTAIDALASESQ